MTEDQIKHMAEKFLNWRLPENFNPDGGISYEPMSSKGTKYEHKREMPFGTNIIGYTEAVAMVRHMAKDLPPDCGSRFRDDLRALVNMRSMENGSNTPDYILATFLADALAAFDKAVSERSGWYGSKVRMVETQESK